MSTTSIMPQPPRFGRQAFGLARGEGEGVEIGARSAARCRGRSTLTATVLAAIGSRDLRRDAPARSRRPRPAARTTTIGRRQRLAERVGDHALGLGLRERRHLVLQRFEIARQRDADHVGPRRQELSELHIGRPEPRQRHGEPRARCGRSSAARSAAPARSAMRAGNGSGFGSASANTPSRANTKPARARRARWENARSITSRQPECSATTPPVICWNETRREAGRADHVGECFRPRKTADRFDEIAIGFGVAGHRRPSAGMTLNE